MFQESEILKNVVSERWCTDSRLWVHIYSLIGKVILMSNHNMFTVPFVFIFIFIIIIIIIIIIISSSSIIIIIFTKRAMNEYFNIYHFNNI